MCGWGACACVCVCVCVCAVGVCSGCGGRIQNDVIQSCVYFGVEVVSVRIEWAFESWEGRG